MIEGMSADEFIRRNADPIWLHQNELWEYMEPEGESDSEKAGSGDLEKATDIPF